MPTPSVSTLKDQVTDIVDGLPDDRETVEALREVQDIIEQAIRAKVDKLLDDRDDADQADTSSEFLPQPERVQLSEDVQVSIHLQRPETDQAARKEWSTIRAALEKNNDFMRALKAHQAMGAELTITRIEGEIGKEGCFVEFENVADNLDIHAQEEALAALTNDQKENYIQDRVQQFDASEQGKVASWIRKQLIRSTSAQGLNYIEADMLVWTHGRGRLIAHDSLQEMAEKKPELYESTLTWHEGEFAEIMRSGFAWSGARNGGDAARAGHSADCRDSIRGGRVSRLRVRIS